MTEQLGDKELIQNLLNQVKVLFNELKSTTAASEDKEFDLNKYKTELTDISVKLAKFSNDLTLAYKPPLSKDSKLTIINNFTNTLTLLTSKITQLPTTLGNNLIDFHNTQLEKILKNTTKLVNYLGQVHKFELEEISLEEQFSKVNLGDILPPSNDLMKLNENLWNSILQLKSLPFSNKDAVLIKYQQYQFQLVDVLEELEDLEMQEVIPEDEELTVLNLQPSNSLSAEHITIGTTIKNYLNLIQKLFKKVELRVIKTFEDSNATYLDDLLQKVILFNEEIDNLVSLIWETEPIDQIKLQFQKVLEVNEEFNELAKTKLTDEHLKWLDLFNLQLQKIKDQVKV
ncbi:hypothetical protein CONCODRAFT_77853 [Conidiobolus coronatus NRRL 28638]|uniref:Uncharacterized protein n=1 Tax=Conidiobolus coronatus (strain ATCC 28846 / CBS 209.66 / NRRL 28638) TaxID=796925 RepID=A0A137PBK9_CONC2|nr:hypothetical protein CONCODRAFT_77853 [Conidiobolus coronatus NRRL 28638]|eukprot:KXN72346.1 hypothetical protein CONCODRAFT_77853 [Conidiobolus coronatus NRRL 28638]